MKEEEERTPLRTILQNFLNHIEKLDKEKLEGSYDKEFQELKLFSEFLKTSKQYSCSQGEKEVNRKKNRYKDILPFDCSRVILEDYAGIPGSDYINANFIKGASGSPAYIASQGPLPHTVNDFWRMVVQCEVQVIVMACNEEEAGKHKCENYWVEQEGEEKQFGMVAIQLIKASVVCPDFLVRTMRLKYTKNHSAAQEERTVCQFHYSAWPDHGVPPLVRPLLDMVRLVRDTQASETLPVLVHCSAGCGRTGTICAIDYVWGLLRAGKLTRDFSLFKLVREMRKQRIAMVQTKEQYILVHHAVKELFNEQLRMIDSHPYENIDVNGMVKESPEPLYATITPEIYNEEKQDTNEKEGVQVDMGETPPLPCKRKPYTAHTKQEKEVENLSQKQRATVLESTPPVPPPPATSSPVTPSPPATSPSASPSGSGGLLHKPRIAKLRALFERSSNREGKSSQVKHRSPQQVTRSHSLGAVRKLEDVGAYVQPIPNRGILRVPQLNVVSDATYVRSGRPALPIKRSKSLKVLSSGERSKFSVPGLQGNLSLESRYKGCGEEACRDASSNTKVRSVGDISGKEDAKPLVPPKKVLKDKVSEWKVMKSTSSVSKMPNSQVLSSSKKNNDAFAEHSQLSSVDGWRRRSLDSLPIESEVSPLILVDNTTKLCSRQEPRRLDEEAHKLFEDCRDYLNRRTNSDSSRVLVNSEKIFRDSPIHRDSLSHLAVEAQRKVQAVVTGLGTRERRNSFRQAISKEPEVNRRKCEYEPLWVNKSPLELKDSRTTSETSDTSDRSSTNPSQLRVSHSKTPNSSFSPQIPAPLARMGKSGKLTIGQKVVTSTSSVFPKSGVDPAVSVVAAGKQFSNQSNGASDCGNINVNINCEGKRPQQLESTASSKNLLLNEFMYSKGNVDGCGSVRHDLRPIAQVSLPLKARVDSSTSRLSEVVCVPNERRVSGHVGNSDTGQSSEKPEYKNLNVAVVRRVTTSKGRYMSPTASGMKSSSRVGPAGATHEPQALLMETSHSGGATKEQISIIGDAAVGFSPRTTESRSGSSKGGSKGDMDPCIPIKVEAILSNKGAERQEVGGGAIRRVHAMPGPANALVRSKSNLHGVAPKKLEHRFWGVEPKPSGVKLGSGQRDTAIPVSGAGGVLVTTAANVQTSGRVVPKIGVMQATERKMSENSSSSSSSSSNPSNVSKKDLEAWIGAPGVDVDLVGASIKPSREPGTPLARALEAFHLRRASQQQQQQRMTAQPQVFVKKQHYL